MNDQATQQHGEKAVDIGSYKYIFCVDVNSVELTRKTGRLETGTNTTMADKYSLNPMFQKMAVAKSVLTHSPTKQLEAEGKQVRSLCVGDPDCIGSTTVIKIADEQDLSPEMENRCPEAYDSRGAWVLPRLRATHERPGHAAARRKAVDIGSYKYIFCVDVNSVELTRKTGRLETGTNTTMADKYSLNPMFQKVAVAKSVLTHSPTKQLEAEGKQVRSLCVGDPDCDPHERMQARNLEKTKRIKYDLATEVLVSNRAQQSVY
ncbi:hypothetical protein PR002_g6287 [Phytophthora rubi]|uniref:Uncharacterized protein n=1 Tax=Phytophthora rubi TaxID=129364 RepID=A0A6A3N8C0_9STRA|nr:hypothetical protein PR002_g6287 [Phytophthora rubi]